ncbi:polysaccharide deacetylase family protein [Deinococcus altitudinis]
MKFRSVLLTALLGCAALFAVAQAQTVKPSGVSLRPATPGKFAQVSPVTVPATPSSRTPPESVQPGQVQPLAPGTLPAPRLPRLTLNPAIPEVQKIEYLGNGHIEVAGAVLTLTLDDQSRARALAGYVARRVLAAREQLDEVDVSVYDKASYGGFGGPLPLLTASVPRDRLDEFLDWSAGKGTYDRAWISTMPGVAPTRRPEPVRELTVNFLGSLADKAADAVHHTTAKVLGGVQGGLLYHGSARSTLSALTFDDAPHPMYEPLLLDILRRENVHATFFVIGRNARAYPYFVKDMVDQGHEVGNHTYHHVRLPPLPIADAVQELMSASQVIQGITGKPVRYFRPPGGDYTPATLRAAESLGLTTVFWTDDPGDFQNPGVRVLIERYTKTLRRGGIVLLHDNAPEMLQVLPTFLRLAQARRIELDTVGVLVGQSEAGKPDGGFPLSGRPVNVSASLTRPAARPSPKLVPVEVRLP